ncbi:MAG: D-amino acid dehydrogenase [Candidatus Marinimicrobia bacterium]|nr:D-amino acid dehydrogenase [Candidatus Neomarinimicrobiota bacterium]
MHILILGAGVIGVTTAYELLKKGHEVSIIDRQPEPAMETSFGNAGLIAPGHSYAWTTPKLPGNLFKSIYQKKRAFRFKFQWDPAMWYWGIKFIRQCTIKNMTENTLRKHKLSSYSQVCFHQLVEETNIKYHENKKGLIYFFRSEESFFEGKQKLTMLKPMMSNLQILSRDELLQKEPALLESQSNIFGGIYCSSDESGSCRDFTLSLVDICRKMGAKFHFNTNVQSIKNDNQFVNRIEADKGSFQADQYVLACAAFSPIIAKMVGDYLPIYPVKGYSITVPIINHEKVPLHSGIDEDNMLAFSLMGDYLRFTSVAEISGYDTRHKPSDFKEIIDIAKSLFPSVCDFSRVEYWAGLRPMTPNGAPIFGKGRMDNLFFNTGHGHLGWTMCSGSAKITASLIEGQKPELDLEGMTLATT